MYDILCHKYFSKSFTHSSKDGFEFAFVFNIFLIVIPVKNISPIRRLLMIQSLQTSSNTAVNQDEQDIRHCVSLDIVSNDWRLSIGYSVVEMEIGFTPVRYGLAW